MTVTQLRAALQVLEAQGHGDLQVCAEAGYVPLKEPEVIEDLSTPARGVMIVSV